MNRLTMENADAIKKSVTAKQIKHMEVLYDDMCHEMTLRAIRIANKTNFSSYVQRALYSQLKRQLSEVSEEYAKKTVKDIKDGMFRVSNAVVADNSDWLSKLGFGTSKEIAQAFSHIPKDVVYSIASGKLYKQGWGLTKSIWGSNQQIIKNINTIVAEGVGQNLSVQEIAENIQNYTGKKPNWNFKCRDGRRIYSRKVSYDAQRVARTCTQHAYQQSFVNMVKDNPFIEYIIWRATGSRACPLCRSRDGMLFKKDEVPLDHPNGMCTLEPYIPSYEKINVELVDWFNSDIGDFPEIDEFAESLGIDASKLKNKTIPTPTPTAQKPKNISIASDKANEKGKKEEFTKEWVFKNCTSPRMAKGWELDIKKTRDTITEKLSKNFVSDSYKNAFSKASKKINKFTREIEKDAGSFYARSGRGNTRYINLSTNFIEKSRDNSWSAVFHEMGHAIDDLARGELKYSSMKKFNFEGAMLDDLDNIVRKLNDKNSDFEFDDFSYVLTDVEASGVTDVLSGAKFIKKSKQHESYKIFGNYRYKWGHSDEYWLREDVSKEMASELFAHISSAQVSTSEMEYMKEMFPECVKVFDEILEEIMKKIK